MNFVKVTRSNIVTYIRAKDILCIQEEKCGCTLRCSFGDVRCDESADTVFECIIAIQEKFTSRFDKKLASTIGQ